MPDESPHLTIRWGDETYTTGELTAADMIAMEEEWGEPFGAIDFRTIKATCWLVWLVRRHHDPEVSLDDVTSVTAGALVGSGAVPPTEGSPRAKRKSGRSGARGTGASTASAPGSSSA